MTLYKNKYRIESARLSGWDYSNDGYYFITICVKNMESVFGIIKNNEIILSETGKIIESEWLETKNIRKYIELDEYVIMPDHFHAIIGIYNQIDNKTKYMNKQNLSNIVRGFKGSSTKKIHLSGNIDFQWQSRFYDVIIKNESDLNRIREYIKNNPFNWNKNDYFV
jgi:putative transposase